MLFSYEQSSVQIYQHVFMKWFDLKISTFCLRYLTHIYTECRKRICLIFEIPTILIKINYIGATSCLQSYRIFPYKITKTEEHIVLLLHYNLKSINTIFYSFYKGILKLDKFLEGYNGRNQITFFIIQHSAGGRVAAQLFSKLSNFIVVEL